jgi:hypothetical protein
MAGLFRWLKTRFETFDLLPDYFGAVVKNWHDILWGASVFAVAFLIWWFLGNPPTWIIGVYLVGAMFIAGYYAWRSDHLRLIPKLEIAQIVLTPTPTDQQIQLIVVHIIPKCLTDAPVEGCKGYLLRVLRWSEDTKDWAPTEIDEPLDLLWSIYDDDLPRTLHPGIEKRFNLCWINQSRQVLLLGRVPLRWQEVFNQTDQFRFDVRITAKNCPPADASIAVRIGDDWKSPSVQKL